MVSRPRPSSPFVALVFVAMVGCGGTSSGRGAPAGGSSSSAPEALTAEQLTPGSVVLVERAGQWLPGSVVARIGPDRVRVHYEGYGPEWDEDVGPERLRPSLTTSAQVTAGLGSAPPLTVGEVALVDLAGRLMLARIVEALPDGKLKVQYDGFEPAAFEEVLAERLKRPFSGPTKHPVGAAVTVRAQGSSAAASVVAVVSEDRWLVRFDGAGAAYDRVVGPDMLVGSAASTSPSHPPDATAGDHVATGGAALSVGAEVLVSHRGIWHLATVVAVRGAETVVRYAAQSSGGAAAGGAGEETVPSSRIVPAPGEKKPGAAYAPKAKVYIEWHGMFVEGNVLQKTGAGQYKVRFEGTGPANDEIVVARRLRPRD